MSFDAVILAAGEFPRRGGAPWRLLAAARRVVACDGAADSYRRRFGKDPDVTVGDLDSIRPTRRKRTGAVVRVDEQETNDLEKAIRHCRARGWKRLVVVGASGRREDHLIGNVFRCLALDVEMVTDFGRFVPVLSGTRRFAVAKGAAVSVFAPDPTTEVKSRGLVWPLDGVAFENLYCATLNRASASTVTLTTTAPISVFLAS